MINDPHVFCPGEGCQFCAAFSEKQRTRSVPARLELEERVQTLEQEVERLNKLLIAAGLDE